MIRGLEAGRVLWLVLDPASVTFPFLAWLPRPPQLTVPVIVAAWLGLALAFTLGKRVRLTGSLLAVVMAYTLLLDEQTYSNNLYLLILVVGMLALAPNPAPFLRWQLTIVYAFAALRKLTPTYLSGLVVASHLPVTWEKPFAVMSTLAIGSLFAEAFLAGAFWSPRLRPAAWAVGLTLHLGCTLLLAPGFRLQLFVFSLEMVALYTAFGLPRCRRFARYGDLARSAPRAQGWVSSLTSRPTPRIVKQQVGPHRIEADFEG